jgi:hypothetical protein
MFRNPLLLQGHLRTRVRLAVGVLGRAHLYQWVGGPDAAVQGVYYYSTRFGMCRDAGSAASVPVNLLWTLNPHSV